MGENTPGQSTQKRVESPKLEEIQKMLEEFEQKENDKYFFHLKTPMRRAKDLEEALRREKLIKELPFNENTLKTLRSIDKPNEYVQNILVAFYLLLGEYECYTRVRIIFIDNHNLINS